MTSAIRSHLRPMTDSDAEAVTRIDRAAFARYRREHGQDETLARSRESVLWNLAKDPEGCFVAEVDGRLAGHVFSRRWGVVGWTGVLGVDPAHQGRGLGRVLLRRSREHLLAAGCRYVGLETMPDSATNLGFYLGEGYRVDRLTLGWRKDHRPEGESPSRHAAGDPTRRSAWVSAEPGGEGLEELSRLAPSVLPGLDFATEVGLMLAHRMGDVLLVRDRGSLVAAAALRLSPIRVGSGPASDEPASAEFILLKAGLEPDPILAEIERQVAERGRKALALFAECRRLGGGGGRPTADLEPVLARRGYRIFMSSLRLLMTESPDPNGLIGWRWAG